MNRNDYFCNWSRVVDFNQMQKAINQINKLSLRDLCPAYKSIFKAFTLCDYNDLKVIMLGQDPYPQRGVATGILFGNNVADASQVSPSLRVILKAARGEEWDTGDYNLENWCKQGILMINASLTTLVGQVGIHGWIWRPFISSLLKEISLRNRGLVFILFGKDAQSFESCISKGNFILKEKHPAYYARLNQPMPKTVFADTRKLLEDYWNYKIVY